MATKILLIGPHCNYPLPDYMLLHSNYHHYYYLSFLTITLTLLYSCLRFKAFHFQTPALGFAAFAIATEPAPAMAMAMAMTMTIVAFIIAAIAAIAVDLGI